MKNSWKIFRSDLRRITSSVIAVVVIMGLCLVPCLYAWFNILSNWDPYGPASTSNIKVAVANEDTGYELLGIPLNIGELVLEGLQNNDQMGWVFVDSRYDALEGVAAGDYYAALIIPKRFTRDFLGILRGDLEHPEIGYYENMKKNAIAPKITNKAKTAVQDQINSTIIEKAVGVIDTLNKVFRAFGLDPDEALDKFVKKLDDTCEGLDRLTTVLTSSQGLLGDTQNLLDYSSIFVNDAGVAMISTGNSAGSINDSVGVSAELIDNASGTIESSLNSIDVHLQRIIRAAELDPSVSSKERTAAQLSSIEGQLGAISAAAPGLTQLPDALSALQGMKNTAGAAPDYTGLDNSTGRTAMTNQSSALSTLAGDMSAQCSTLMSGECTAAAAGASTLSTQLGDGVSTAAELQATLADIQAKLLIIQPIAPATTDTALLDAQNLYTLAADADSADNGAAVRGELSQGAVRLSGEIAAVSSALDSCRTCCTSIQTSCTTINEDMTNLTRLDTDEMRANLDEAERLIQASNLPQKDTWLAEIAAMRQLIDQSDDPLVRADIADKARSTSTSIRETALEMNTNINNYVQETSKTVQKDLTDAQRMLYETGLEAKQLSVTLGAYAVAVGETQSSMGEAVKLAQSIRAGVAKLADDVREFAKSDAFKQLVDVIENNPDGLAEYLASPVIINNEIVYEIGDYGSAMSPYYIMLALFVGSLLAATMIKVQVSSPDIVSLRPAERYFGRFLLFFFIGMAQALVTALGCLYYVGIQCHDPLLFILACCICSLNFAMMNFALVYALDNIGMGAAVIIMVIQVAGSGGSYPVDVLPEVYKKLYPFMPFHYGMDMIRETIGGRYDGTYLRCAAILLGMCVLFTAMGLLLYYPAKGINKLIADSKEATGIM